MAKTQYGVVTPRLDSRAIATMISAVPAMGNIR